MAVPEAAPIATGRFDDLPFGALAGRERLTILRLDFVLVMGASQGLRDAVRRTTSAPPRQITRRGSSQKRASSGFHSLQQCSVCSTMPVYFEQHDCSFVVSGRRVACALFASFTFTMSLTPSQQCVDDAWQGRPVFDKVSTLHLWPMALGLNLSVIRSRIDINHQPVSHILQS